MNVCTKCSTQTDSVDFFEGYVKCCNTAFHHLMAQNNTQSKTIKISHLGVLLISNTSFANCVAPIVVR